MSTPVSSIRNLGPASLRAYARAGIDSAETLRTLGPDTAYRRLIEAGEKPHFIGYYALVMGLMGRPWTDCRGAEKADLRIRFDAIVAAAGGASGAPHDAARERLLDEIGLPRPRSDRDRGNG